jgi:hypothetical protein
MTLDWMITDDGDTGGLTLDQGASIPPHSHVPLSKNREEREIITWMMVLLFVITLLYSVSEGGNARSSTEACRRVAKGCGGVDEGRGWMSW